MQEQYLCISIPIELQQYQKQEQLQLPNSDNDILAGAHDFGVKLVKNAQGELDYSAYYSDSGELLKRIYYNGSSVSNIKYYRNNLLHTQEEYSDGKVNKKSTYDRSGSLTSTIRYEYNKQGQVTAIRKTANSSRYEVVYGYDELKRVNSRKIVVNLKVINEQHYKYDILDRVVEYSDMSQTIKVHKINQKNQLIHYTITDKAGNDIGILNKYLCSEYIGTEIDLNGHKTSVNNKSYTDNVMLKKPFTSEDDLDFVISNIFGKSEGIMTKRSSTTDISESCINNRIHDNKPLPISIRKRLLLTRN